MKYVLRIVIVLVMIVGIVFGVRYFVNKNLQMLKYKTT